MTARISALIIAVTAGLTAMPLYAAVTAGDVVGTSEMDIRTALEAQGYVIDSIEFEKDEIEVEASLEGQKLELELSVETGMILEIELEDD